MTDLSDIRAAALSAAQDAVDNSLGDLLGERPDQHTRLLRLHTPLGPDVLLAERACITEGIGPHPEQSTFAIELLALSNRVDLPPADLIGQPVLLELLTAQSHTELRPFHGHVLAFELLGSDGGYARYRLRIGAWLDFLRYRTDSWVFQDKSVVEITEEVFADYAGQGALQPTWRWDLKDPGAYPRLSTFSQHAETDFGFLQRMWAANGLFCWFEHEGDPGGSGTLGTHTLVIADHNGALTANTQNCIRFTQPGAVMKEDSITRWHGSRRVGATMLNTASFDYRSVAHHAATMEVDAGHDQPMPLVHTDQPGAYAYETPEEAARLSAVQLQSLQAQRKQFNGLGTVRTLAPATTFVLADHAEHDPDIAQAGEDSARFAVLSVVHRARNNMSADAKAGLQHLLGHALLGGEHAPAPEKAADNQSAEPLYEAAFTAQRASVAVRPALVDDRGALLHAKPTAWGTQTALVVGLEGNRVHTDRDGRVKVQFHWQRGQQSSHRQSHPAGDNAPASDASGTWVRVAQPWSGANWGGMFIPRIGQEVVVAFIEGNIDRPVIVGVAYNGQGNEDAQGNAVACGAANATGNAPAWFPGTTRHGEHEGHAHTATLSGFKSQSLEASQSGAGGYNQLVFDDTPGQGRVLAHTTQSQTWLQIGHLLQQNDNQRLAARGHGLELHTQAQGALRAGSGLHISTHPRDGGTGTGQGQPIDTREAQSQLQGHAGLVMALSENAQTHLAQLPAEPAPDKLNAQQALQATLRSLAGLQSSGNGSVAPVGSDHGGAGAHSNTVMPVDGGHGSIPVSERPDIVLSAAADISSATPAHTVIAVAQHTTVTAGQDTNLLSQRHAAWAIKDGISLFTRGEAKDGPRAVQDIGMKLHAASGNVNLQAQSDAFRLTAQKAVDLQSAAANVTISAPNKILLNGGGSYIKIEGGDIEIGTSGQACFWASMKALTGGTIAFTHTSLGLHAPGELHVNPVGSLSVRPAILGGDELAILAGWVGLPYRLYSANGEQLTQGHISAAGRIERIAVRAYERMVLEVGSAHNTAFAPLSSTPIEPTHSVDHDGVDEEEADTTWDDPTHRAQSPSGFKSTCDSTQLVDAFLGADVAKALLMQLGIDPGNDD